MHLVILSYNRNCIYFLTGHVGTILYHMSITLKKPGWRSILWSKLTLGFLILLAIGLSISVFDRFKIERQMAERRNEKETQLNLLKERKEVLEDKVKYLSEDSGVEAEVRKHFDVAKEGEQVVVLLENDNKSNELTLSTTSQNSEENKGFWSWFIPW